MSARGACCERSEVDHDGAWAFGHAYQPKNYYPEMPPALPGETDEQYTDRLTGAYGIHSRVSPYNHPRFRQCSIGYHDECSRNRDGDDGCKCPCHDEPGASA